MREDHHRTDLDLAVHDHQALLDLGQDRALWRIDDGRRHERAEHAAIRDGERAASRVFDADGTLARLGGVRVSLDFADPLVSASQIWDRQATVVGPATPMS